MGCLVLSGLAQSGPTFDPGASLAGADIRWSYFAYGSLMRMNIELPYPGTDAGKMRLADILLN